MSAINQLLILTGEYQRAAGLTEATVSTHLFNDGKKLGAIRNGADLSTKRFEAALQTLSDRWPEGAVWPAEIDRPSRTEAAA
jgi:hypothetical protein